MGHVHQITQDQPTGNVITPVRRSPLTPGLASAAKRLGIRPDAVKRHEQFEKERAIELDRLTLQRNASKAKYEALKGTVDQLVNQIQDVAQAPSKAQTGDIQNIRTLLKQATRAMERQQVELKGIRARTQRMERAAMKADTVHKEVSDMQEEIYGYQRSLHAIRRDMADLVEIVEGHGGLKDLAADVRHVQSDLKQTKERTQALEDNALEQSARTMKLEQDMVALRAMVESSMSETAGVAGAMLSLREEMHDLRNKVGRYIIDQIKFFRK
jgi:chromosome segregation ATPase